MLGLTRSNPIYGTGLGAIHSMNNPSLLFLVMVDLFYGLKLHIYIYEF